MKTIGKCTRNIKNPKKCFFNRQEPYSRERAFEAKEYGSYKYKQSICRKNGGKYGKSTKF